MTRIVSGGVLGCCHLDVQRLSSDAHLAGYHGTIEKFNYVGAMNSRSRMTVRRVRQGSREAAESRVEGTMDERLALVSVLSLSAWANSGRPLPVYRREDIPVCRTTLNARRDRD